MTNNIKKIRQSLNITQNELSKLTGFSQSKLSQYEHIPDLSNITVGTIAKIAKFLGVTVNDLIYEKK